MKRLLNLAPLLGKRWSKSTAEGPGSHGSASAAEPGELSIIDAWIETGRTGEMASTEPHLLLQRLKSSSPPESVKIVGALAGRVWVGSPEANVLLQNEHWMVRFAACAVGLGSRIEADEPNHWVRELGAAKAAVGKDLVRASSAPTDTLLRPAQEAPAQQHVNELLRPGGEDAPV
jgi:hypothetical protein